MAAAAAPVAVVLSACWACGLEENNNQKKVKDIAREEIIEQGPVV